MRHKKTKKTTSRLTYEILSHGGRRRTWQKTWHSRSAGSRCPYSSCMQHMRQKCAIRCCSVLPWCGGKALTRLYRAASHCSTPSTPSHHCSSTTGLLPGTAYWHTILWTDKKTILWQHKPEDMWPQWLTCYRNVENNWTSYNNNPSTSPLSRSTRVSRYQNWLRFYIAFNTMIGHFGDILPGQSLSVVPKKLKLTQQKYTHK